MAGAFDPRGALDLGDRLGRPSWRKVIRSRRFGGCLERRSARILKIASLRAALSGRYRGLFLPQLGRFARLLAGGLRCRMANASVLSIEVVPAAFDALCDTRLHRSLVLAGQRCVMASRPGSAGCAPRRKCYQSPCSSVAPF